MTACIIQLFSAKKVNEMEIKPKSGRCYNKEHVENNTNVETDAKQTGLGQNFTINKKSIIFEISS